MKFDFIVARYRKNSKSTSNKEHILAGFDNLKDAKRYVEHNYDPLFWSAGFFFINTPQGKHIYGCDRQGRDKWYLPDETKDAFIYDERKDDYIKIDSYMPIQDYHNFIGKDSVLAKIKKNSDKPSSEKTPSIRSRDER